MQRTPKRGKNISRATHLWLARSVLHCSYYIFYRNLSVSEITHALLNGILNLKYCLIKFHCTIATDNPQIVQNSWLINKTKKRAVHYHTSRQSSFHSFNNLSDNVKGFSCLFFLINVIWNLGV